MRLPSFGLSIGRKNSKYIFGLLALLMALAAVLLYSGKQRPEEAAAPAGEEAVQVSVQSYGESRELTQTLDFPAIVAADEEGSIVAKTAGTVKSADFKVGDKVRVGQELVRIDDVSAVSGNYAVGFTAAQVKQAALGVEQARAAYLQAEQGYRDALAASERDLNQAAIARDQAAQGRENLGLTTGEALKSAELAYETAKTAAQQARAALENRRAISGQSGSDVRTNSDVAADGAIAQSGFVITSIDNILSLDDGNPVPIAYKTNLGAQDPDTYTRAKGAYAAAQALYESARSAAYPDVAAKLDAAIALAQAAKTLADGARSVLEKTVTSLALPQSSANGVSLSGLLAQVSGYQSQMTAVLSQVNGAKQGINNTDLNNDAVLDGLEKAYEIAKTQEALALQNLSNLKAGNKAQADNAAFGLSAAENQYQSLGIKLGAQVSAARTQLTVAELSYRNAQTALQGLYDSRLGVAPINGTVTKKLVSEGDTVSPGQVLAVVSEASQVALSFYVDRESVGLVKEGQPVRIAYDGAEPAPGRITSVALLADSLTKRFQVEARPDRYEAGSLALGTVVDVILDLKKRAAGDGAALLPISAVNIGQGGNSIMVARGGRAESVPVEVLRVEGEAVEIKAALAPEELVIVGNNKRLNPGTPVKY